MKHCVNIHHTDVLELSKQLGLPKIVVASKIAVWQSKNTIDRFPTIDELKPEQEINYTFKAVKLVTDNLDKIISWSSKIKDKELLYKKIQELGIPKEQIELLKNSEGNNVEEQLANFLANYSFIAEINVTKANKIKGIELDDYNTLYSQYHIVEEKGQYAVYHFESGQPNKTFNTREEAQEYVDYWNLQEVNSSYYSNLTVPGGTNYTENEIATPAIVPSIKGHAQFSSNNGIGWFRSDEQIKGGYVDRIKVQSEDFAIAFDAEGNPYQTDRIETRTTGGTSTKTRRILEVQSDLFQKGREKKDLVGGAKTYIDPIEGNEIIGLKEEDQTFSNENQFLQLLNKDHNWVTFFIKSIIQDSVSKGYEKVLFPSGNTASKVEGHTTLEEFKKQKEERLKIIQNERDILQENKKEEVRKFLLSQFWINSRSSEKEIEEERIKLLNTRTIEIDHLKEELARTEKEGFARLKPIYNFYENQVKNILKKNYNIKEVIDEYGNTWNEVELSKESLSTIYLQIESENQIQSKIEKEDEFDKRLRSILSDYGIKVEVIDNMFERFGVRARGMADIATKTIYLSRDKVLPSTLSEETAHFIIEILKSQDSPLFNRLIILAKQSTLYDEVYEQYKDVYKNNAKLIEKEVAGKLLSQYFANTWSAINEPRKNWLADLLHTIKMIFERVKQIFSKSDVARIDREIEQVYGDLANELFLNPKKYDAIIERSDDLLYQLDVNISIEEQALKNAIEVIHTKTRIYNNISSTRTAKDKKLLEDLIADFNAKNNILGLQRYVRRALEDTQQTINRLKDVRRKIAQAEIQNTDLNELSRELSTAYKYIQAYSETVKEISSVYRNSDEAEDLKLTNPESMQLFKESISELTDNIEYVHTEYKLLSVPLFSKFLQHNVAPRVDKDGNMILYGQKFDKEVTDLLIEVDKDISFSETWLDSMAEANDDILKMIDKIVKNAKSEAYQKSLDVEKYLLKEQNKLGQTNYDFAVDSSGFNLISEYNFEGYNEERKKMMEEYNKMVEEGEKETDKVLRQRKLTQARRYRRSWFKSNSVIVDEKQLAEMFGDRLELILPHIYQFPINPGNLTPQFSIPADKYKEARFFAMSEKQRSFYNNVAAKYLEQQLLLPKTHRMGLMLPQIEKDSIERLKQGSTKEKLESLKRGAINSLTTRTSDTEYGMLDETLEPVKVLPVLFGHKVGKWIDTRTGKEFTNLKLVPEEFRKFIPDSTSLSRDIVSTISNYSAMANRWHELNKVVGSLELGKDVVRNRKLILTNEKGNWIKSLVNWDKKNPRVLTKEGFDTNAYHRLEAYYDMVLYGHTKEKEGNIGKTNLNKAKVMDKLGQYTAISSLALNVYSGISNLTMGNTMLASEGLAGEFFSYKDLWKARKTYWANVPSQLYNVGKNYNTSKLALWMEYFNVLQEDGPTKELNTDRSRASKLLNTSSLFFLNSAGENFMQSSLSLALAHNTKMKDGTDLWEAMEVVENKLQPKAKYKEEVDALYNKFVNTQDFLNQRLNGIYNEHDKSTIQRYALGRLALLFRKFIKPGWNRRWAKMEYSERAETLTEGTYISLIGFMSNLIKDLRQKKFLLQTHWEELQPFQRKNVIRSLYEIGVFISAITLGTILSNLAGDDDDDWALNMMAYQANRLYTESTFYWNPGEALKLLQSPSAAVNQLDKVINWFEVWNWPETIERGKWKGHTKFFRNTVKIIPVAGTVVDVFTPEEKLKFFNRD